jgi:hypothetical protein
MEIAFPLKIVSFIRGSAAQTDALKSFPLKGPSNSPNLDLKDIPPTLHRLATELWGLVEADGSADGTDEAQTHRPSGNSI